MSKKIYIALLAVCLPLFASAQGYLPQTRGILESIQGIVTRILIPLAFALALLFFFWGLAKYIWSVGKAKEEGRNLMVWGVIALFVMTTIWGIVYFIERELGVTRQNNVTIPGINYGSSGSSGSTNIPW